MIDLDIEVFSDLEQGSRLWAELAGDALASPYQAFDWESAWWRHVAEPAGESLKLVSLRRDGSLIALLPLSSRREMGVCVARFLGGTHFNLQLPIWQGALCSVLGDLPVEQLLRRIGAVIQADVVELSHQPRTWQGRPNPFVSADAEECVSPTFALPLSNDFDTLSRAQRSAKSLQQIRRKRKLLQKACGEVAFRCALDAASRERAIEAVIRQRNARRDLSGIPSFFDMPGGEAFIRDVAGRLSDEDGFHPPLRIDYLEVGGEIAATYFGAVRSGVYSCFLNSFEPKFEHYSPGEIILHDLVEVLCAGNMTLLDLGVGVEQYKKSWCDPVPLFAVTVALTARGHVHSSLKRLRQQGKRIIKRNETLWRAWRNLRRITTSSTAVRMPTKPAIEPESGLDDRKDHAIPGMPEAVLIDHLQRPDTSPAPEQDISSAMRRKAPAKSMMK
jgi:CelD/BcsL family acetyltransferase involved in cellulose biosynthesis